MRDSEGQSDPIGQLLQLGLDHYGRNDVAQAVRCWKQVLALDPLHPQARDYLEAAGVSVEANAVPARSGAQVIDLDSLRAQIDVGAGSGTPLPDGTVLPSVSANAVLNQPSVSHPDGEQAQAQLENLLREQRWEEALESLYTARSRHPRDAGLSRSIRLLRERLVLAYACRLGNLDNVPDAAPSWDRSKLTSEERQVAALIDGISSYGDILASSALGRLATLRTLCAFQQNGYVEVDTASSRTEFAAVASLPPVVPSVHPPAAVAQSQDRASAEPDPYEEKFNLATQAYLRRDYESAAELFEQCVLERPEDTRAQHNLKTLRRRLGNS